MCVNEIYLIILWKANQIAQPESSLPCNFPCICLIWDKVKIEDITHYTSVVYIYIYWIHTDAMITDAVINDRRMKEDTWRKTQEWRMHDKDAGSKTQEGRHKKTSLEKYSPLTLLQGFERVVKGLHVRGCWRPNINFIFWPHCYDRHVVSFLFS